MEIIQACGPVGLFLVDGYVWLGENHPGLGAHLHQTLGGKLPVVGVAKNQYKEAPGVEVLRGGSTRPLFVTSVGIDVSLAAECVRTMHGPHRLPTMIKLVDHLCRNSHANSL